MYGGAIYIDLTVLGARYVSRCRPFVLLAETCSSSRSSANAACDAHGTRCGHPARPQAPHGRKPRRDR
jgi:hypothetical protein